MTAPLEEVDTVTAVYDGVLPEHLDEALQSLRDQTLAPSRVVVVADGPLTEGLEAVIVRHSQTLPLRVVRLPERSGPGPARQAGFRATRAPIIAIADADDISLPQRLERQIQMMRTEAADLVGTAVWEFEGDPADVLGIRAFPSAHDDLVRRLRSVNPFNHPTVCLRRDVALTSGGYADLPYLEDYDLCARMVARGARVGNLAEPLVLFRGGAASLSRRRARGVARSEWRLQRNLVSYGLVSRPRGIWNWCARTAFRSLPPWVMRRAYRRLFLTALSREPIGHP